MKAVNNRMWILIFFLISIEQAIKIVINSCFLDKRFPILPPVFYFEPMFNRDYSWFNSMLNLGVGRWLHIIVVAVMILVIFLFYQYLNLRIGEQKIINRMFAFVSSGAVCSLIDKVFWNGSLDYIQVKGFFTFDLKDVYIDIFIGLMLLSMVLGNKIIKQIDDKDFLKGFIRYILRRG